MFLHKLAYRHANGEIEGFVGDGSTADAARKDAVRRVQLQLVCKRLRYDSSRLVESDAGLTPEEKKTVRADWEVSKRTGR